MTRNIIWAAAHEPTEQQLKELKEMGKVYYLKDIEKALHYTICNIRFNTRINVLVEVLLDACSLNTNTSLVQPAGSPAFQFALGRAVSLRVKPPQILYAYSERVSNDVPQPNGSIIKTSVFNHKGWIEC